MLPQERISQLALKTSLQMTEQFLQMKGTLCTMKLVINMVEQFF